MLTSSPTFPGASPFWLWIAAAVAVLTRLLADVLTARRRSATYALLAATLPQELLAAEEEKLPLTPAELRPHPPVPDFENAAPFYRRLAEWDSGRSQKGTRSAEDSAISTFLRSKERTDAQRAEIRRLLYDAHEPLFLAERAAACSRCDFARSWNKPVADLSFPELSVMRHTVRYLAARAILAGEEGDPERALQDIGVGLRIGHHATSDPIILSLLVGYAIQMILHRALVEIIKENGDRADVLRKAHAIHGAFRPEPDLRHAIGGEIIIGRCSMEERRHAPDALKKLHKEYGIKVGPVSRRHKQTIINAWESRTIAYWRQVNAALQTADGDLKAAGEAIGKIQQELSLRKTQPGYEIVTAFTPIFSALPAKAMQNQANTRLRSRLLAVLQYRNQHGVFPESLTVLEPASDTADAIDPFTNQPLHYHKTHDGFILYSVGVNLKDDGGSERLDASNWPEDIVVSYP